MPDKVVITGGAGFLGQLLVDQLSARHPGIDITVVDRVANPDQRVRSIVADLAGQPEVLEPLLNSASSTVFHLASVVSSGAEADWSSAIDVNVTGLIGVLEQCRASGHLHRFVFTSSVAVFGGSFTVEPTGDRTKQTPTSTYGMTKAFGELVIDDASRKGFIDGRTARLPTVIIRPGSPNLAASSFCSGLFREPLQGIRSNVPVPLTTPIVVISPDVAVAALIDLSELDGEAIGQNRAVALPGLTVTVSDMMAALERAGGAEALTLLDHVPDQGIADIVAGWPGQWDDARGRALGLIGDTALDDIVDAFVRTHLTP